MPFVVTAVFLGLMYSIKPLELVGSFLISGVVLYLVMVWVGMSTAQKEDLTAEHILYLRMGDARQYYASKLLFLFCIAVLLAAVCTGFPILKNSLNAGELFQEQTSLSDGINGFVLLIGMGLSGASVGELFHPRMLTDRKLAVVLTLTTAVMPFAVPALIQKAPVLAWILWIFPPVMKGSEIYTGAASLEAGKTGLIFGMLAAQAVIYEGIRIWGCRKQTF